MVFLVHATFIGQNMVFNEREVAVQRRCEDVVLSNDARSCSLKNLSQARAANCKRGGALGAALQRQTLTSEANPTAVNSAAENPADTRAEKSKPADFRDARSNADLRSPTLKPAAFSSKMSNCAFFRPMQNSRRVGV